MAGGVAPVRQYLPQLRDDVLAGAIDPGLVFDLEVPLDEYDGKRLVEVGTGSGWIPIALAKFTRLAQIVGVDLNPQAEAVATCNAWLNCDEAQVGRLRFGRSDLLDDLPAEDRWDFVVGCIPQVLRTEGIDEPQGEEEALYDLQLAVGEVNAQWARVSGRLEPGNSAM